MNNERLFEDIVSSVNNPSVFCFHIYGTKDYFDFIEEKFGVIIPDEEKIILPKRFVPEEEDYTIWEIINESK